MALSVDKGGVVLFDETIIAGCFSRLSAGRGGEVARESTTSSPRARKVQHGEAGGF
jgi:hypothetical protein